MRFDALLENPRASLLLVNHTVYLSRGSSCDVEPYHGWVMSYDPHTLAQKGVLNVTPDGSEGGIWASDPTWAPGRAAKFTWRWGTELLTQRLAAGITATRC